MRAKVQRVAWEGTRIDERLRQVFMLTERLVDRAIDHADHKLAFGLRF
jgi:hypothetical protein